MQCLNLKENLIFSVAAEISTTQSEKGDFKKIRMLTSIYSVYFFTVDKVPPTKDLKKEVYFLEDYLYLKFNHEDMYIRNFDDSSIEYEVKTDEIRIPLIIKFKVVSPKEYVKVLLLINGWYIAVQNSKARKSSVPDVSYLFKFIDKYLLNDYVFIIDIVFFLLENKYLDFIKEFTLTIALVNKLKVDIFFKNDLVKHFSNILPDEIKNNYKLCLINLNLTSTNLSDEYFNKIAIKCINAAPNLELLDVSYNLLTNKTFEYIEKNCKVCLNLRALNLSYNNLTSDKLSGHVIDIAKIFLGITLLDFRGNKIDNRFLDNFEPKNFDELRILLELAGVPHKEALVIDLRDTNVEVEKTGLRFYLKKKKDISNNIEMKNVFTENLENKYVGLDRVHFLFDLYFYKRQFYYGGVSKNKINLNINCKNIRLHQRRDFKIIKKEEEIVEKEEITIPKDRKEMTLHSKGLNALINRSESNKQMKNSFEDRKKKTIQTKGTELSGKLEKPNEEGELLENKIAANPQGEAVTVNNLDNHEAEASYESGSKDNNEEDHENSSEQEDSKSKNDSKGNVEEEPPNNGGLADDTQDYDAQIISETESGEENEAAKASKDQESKRKEEASLLKRFGPPMYYIDREPELKVYRELFKYFFLLDLYFDPILNSFSSYESRYIPRQQDFMNDLIIYDQYDRLRNYVLTRKNQRDLTNEEKKEIREIPMVDAVQMYYDYKNYMFPFVSKKDEMGNEPMEQTVLEINEIVNDLFKKVFQKGALRDDERFNPNAFIDQLSYFFYYLIVPQDFKIKIPYTTLNKYISRVKLESILCIKEKSHSSLSYLTKIVSRMKLSVAQPVNVAFNKVSNKAKIILKGLSQVLNFEGRDRVDKSKNFLFEMNNFLDIFLKKAETIELESDLVFIARYVQYLRDNSLRNEVYSSLIELYQKEASITKYNMYEEFSAANDEYKKIKDPIKLNIPKEIIHKELALHPSNLDYLSLSEVNERDFRHDLDEISRLIYSNQSYGKRNLYDRLKFIFVNTSRKKKNEDYLYKLHKGNLYLKVMRVLFRYFNCIDIREIEKKRTLDGSRALPENPSKQAPTRTVIEVNIQESLDNIAIEERYLRILPSEGPEDQNISKIELENRKKLELLKYTDNLHEPETLIDISNVKDISADQANNFIHFTVGFYLKCQERLASVEKVSKQYFAMVIQYYIRYFLDIKFQCQEKGEPKFWEIQNLECFYQLFRFANRDNFDMKSEKNNLLDFHYPFAFLAIMCWYFEFNETMQRRVKGFVYYLFTRMNQRKYCKMIIRALNYPVRYNWIMSTFEIYNKIDTEPMIIDVIFPSHDNRLREQYEIHEDTTTEDLFVMLKEKSEYLKEIVEKGFYWIYYVNNQKPNIFQNLNSDDILVEIIGTEEENEREVEGISNENRTARSKSFIKSTHEFEMMEISGQNGIFSSYTKDKTFKNYHFEVRRRIFTPVAYRGDLGRFSYNEQEIIYCQIKNVFFNSNVVDYTWYSIGEEIAISCYFEQIAQNKREEFTTRSKLDSKVLSMKDIEEIDFPKFQKNENFSVGELGENEQVEIIYPKNLGKIDRKNRTSFNNVRKCISKLGDPKKKFFELVKNYPILYSNTYDVILRQCNDSFPEKFIISVSLEKVQFLYRKNYRKFFEFKYDEIVKMTITEDINLILVVNILRDDLGEEEDGRFEMVAKLETPDCRTIMEDILSYSQLFLMSNTDSDLITRVNEIINTKEYLLVYQRNFTFKEPILIKGNSAEQTKAEIDKMRENMHSTTKYKEYKEEKQKKKKEEEELQKKNQKKGALDIKALKDIPRMNEYDDDEDEDDESNSEVEVKKVNFKKEEKKEEEEPKPAPKPVVVNEEEEKKKKEEEAKQEVLRKAQEEKEKKEREEKEKKIKQNDEKKIKANASLMKAFQDFQFDSDEDEKDKSQSDDN